MHIMKSPKQILPYCVIHLHKDDKDNQNQFGMPNRVNQPRPNPNPPRPPPNPQVVPNPGVNLKVRAEKLAALEKIKNKLFPPASPTTTAGASNQPTNGPLGGPGTSMTGGSMVPQQGSSFGPSGSGNGYQNPMVLQQGPSGLGNGYQNPYGPNTTTQQMQGANFGGPPAALQSVPSVSPYIAFNNRAGPSTQVASYNYAPNQPSNQLGSSNSLPNQNPALMGSYSSTNSNKPDDYYSKIENIILFLQEK
jgi:hypothetical protein